MGLSMRIHFFFLAGLLTCSLHAQQSTFDSDNEDWRADGDPVSLVAGWASMGGLPGGHIRATDAATGGVWYFVAPVKFRGNKCGAYDRMLRYDQFTSDTLNQIFAGNLPDVEIRGNGSSLVFDNQENPGLEWTHFEIPLREDAGWLLYDQNGPVPTEAEFRAILSNITSIRIKGEYRSSADFGGLDNFVLENSFEFDLDGDGSSGDRGLNFNSDTLCLPEGAVADVDAVLISEIPIDSMIIRVLGAGSTDLLAAGNLPPSISLGPLSAPAYIVLINNGNASPADFLAALQTIQYQDISPDPERGERLIGINVFTECGDMGIRFAYLPVFPPPDAGLDGDTIVCANSAPFDLRTVLGGMPEAGGFWSPAPTGGPNSFDPAKDLPGTFQYIILPAGECLGDTARATIGLENLPMLPADTTICYTDTLLLSVPVELLQWQWNDGGQQRERVIDFPGTYTLTGSTGYCTFNDSVQVGFFTCEPCLWYAPNIFSPNDDGENDSWQVFLPCLWQRFRLEIFDRWGSLVFAADDPETRWDGYGKTREPVPGVYIWRIEWVGELRGVPEIHRAAGDITIIR